MFDTCFQNETESSWKSFFNVESLFLYRFCLKKYTVCSSDKLCSQTITHFANSPALSAHKLISIFSISFTINSESTKTVLEPADEHKLT